MRDFNVITNTFSKENTKGYNIMPYLLDRYIALSYKNKPKTFEEFKEFITKESMYQFWCRCQYEIVISKFPNTNEEEHKIDVYDQIMMNIDIITELFMLNCKEYRHNKYLEKKNKK